MATTYLTTLGDVSFLKDVLREGRVQGRDEPRIAVVGRSNVGKSSLINALLDTKLARVSKEPGKTTSIHFYLWSDAKKIVADLPGYGFARTSQRERERWAKFVDAYLQSDPALDQVLLLLDARNGPSELDREAAKFLRTLSVDILIVMTKWDAVGNQKEKASRQKSVVSALKELGYSSEKIQWVSAKSGFGIHALRKTLCTNRED